MNAPTDKPTTEELAVLLDQQCTDLCDAAAARLRELEKQGIYACELFDEAKRAQQAEHALQARIDKALAIQPALGSYPNLLRDALNAKDAALRGDGDSDG